MIRTNMIETKHPNENNLPAPRLQLRWTKYNDGNTTNQYQCHYELVLPLRKHDIRREVYDDSGVMTGKTDEFVVTMKPPTTRRGTTTEPCRLRGGTPFCDEPYRDGAHAQWDSHALGGLPVYVLDLHGQAFLTKPTINHLERATARG